MIMVENVPAPFQTMISECNRRLRRLYSLSFFSNILPSPLYGLGRDRGGKRNVLVFGQTADSGRTAALFRSISDCISELSEPS